MARRSARLVAAAAGLLGPAVLASGCGAVSELIQLEERIERRGYDVESTFHDDFGSSRNEVQVQASSGRGERPPAGNEEIAGIVWETYPRRFDRVAVRLDGDERLFTRGDLQERFGPRDASLDEREFSEDLEEGIRTVAVGASIVLGVGVLAIVATVVLLRRRRRRNPPPPPPPPGYGGGQGWYPPPPPPGPPPGWPAPTPPPPTHQPPPTPTPDYPPPPPGPIR